MKKIFLTGAYGMLGTDFIKYFSDTFEIFPLDRNDGDITVMKTMDRLIQDKKPSILVNFAAYTNVEDAEDVGIKPNFDVNVLGTYNLAKITAKYNINFITISTDYVFDGTQEGGYFENDRTNPINNYGMAKYLGEKLAKQENSNTIIIRTSRLYGGGTTFKNFVNTMLHLSETKTELHVINDQFGNPTYTVDLSHAIGEVINQIRQYRGHILHLTNESEKDGTTRYDFAKEIFRQANKNLKLCPVSSDQFPTKAQRPKFSKLLNSSDIKLRNWKDGLKDYLSKIY